MSYLVRDQILNLDVTDKRRTHYETCYNSAFCQSSAKHTGHEAVQKGNPYHHGVQKYRNTSVILLILHHFTHKKICSNEILHCDV